MSCWCNRVGAFGFRLRGAFTPVGQLRSHWQPPVLRLRPSHARRLATASQGNSTQETRKPGPSQDSRRRQTSRWTIAVAGVGLISVAALASADLRTWISSDGTQNDNLSAHLNPGKYGRFRVLSVHRTTSPSLLKSDPSGDGQHILLRIRASVPASQTASSSASTSDPFRIESVYMKEPALQIERAYTPLRRPGNPTKLDPPIDLANANTAPEETLELLIKRYPDGEVSRYASTLRAGDVVELRGPNVTWDLERDHPGLRAQIRDGGGAGADSQAILMLVGGTGITTAHQLLHSLRGHVSSAQAAGQYVSVLTPNLARVDILYAARSPASFLLLPELVALDTANSGWGGRLCLFSESNGALEGAMGESTARNQALLSLKIEGQGAIQSVHPSPSRPFLSWIWKGKKDSDKILGVPVRHGRIPSSAIQEALHRGPNSQRNGSSPIVLVCGPDGMVAAMAGPKAQDGRGGQGPLGGLLAKLNVPFDHTFKL